VSFVFAGQYSNYLVGQNTSTKALTFPSSCAVRLQGTTTLASLWTSRTKGTAAANPLASGVATNSVGIDTAGNVLFYVDPGRYDIFVNGTYTYTVTVEPDPAEPVNLQNLADVNFAGAADGDYVKINNASGVLSFTKAPLIRTDTVTGIKYELRVTNGVVVTVPVSAAVLPGAPTAVVATVSGTSVSVAFTAGTAGTNATTVYTATASPGGYTGTSATSPITIPNLSPGTYAFTVAATSVDGTGPASAASVAVTVLATPVGSTQLLAYDFAGTNGSVFDASKVIESTFFSHVAPDGSSLLNGQGKIVTNARASYNVNDWTTWRANLTTSADQEALIDVTVSSTDLGAFLALRSDADANANYYQFGFSATGFGLTKEVSYVKTLLANVTTLTASPNAAYRIRARAVGTRIQGRVWPIAAPEPTAWNIDVTDSAVTSGYVTFGVTSGNTAHSDGSVFALFDNFTVNSATGTGSVVAPPPTGGGGTVVGGTGGVGIRYFAGTAYCYQDLSGAPVATDSNACRDDIIRQAKQYYGSTSRTNCAINTTQYSPPIYTAAAGATTVAVTGSSDTGWLSQMSAVPIPSYAVPADGTDQEMIVYSPSLDAIWELWIANKDVSGNWTASWGGKLSNASTANGVFPGSYGTTATSIAFLGGLMTIAELQAAAAGNIDAIGHVIGLALPELGSGHSSPATRDDGGYNPGGSPLIEGRRLRIDPGLNVALLPVNPIVKAVARAAQRYGMVIWDKAGAVTMRAENPKRLTVQSLADPYPAIFGSYANWNVLDAFPWTSIQALPVNY
jgi:hypothetical protein